MWTPSLEWLELLEESQSLPGLPVCVWEEGNLSSVLTGFWVWSQKLPGCVSWRSEEVTAEM